MEMVSFKLMLYLPDQDIYIPMDEAKGGERTFNISGTELRERLAEGRLDDLQSVVPRSVLTWIADHGLYGLSRPN